MREPKVVSTSAVVLRCDAAVENHNAAIAELIECLVEIEEDDVHIEEGYTSLYAFCRERYGMSEGAAYRRIRAARVARRYPDLIESLRRGLLSLEVIALLAPYVDDDPEMLRRAVTMSTRDVRAMIAARHPDPDAPRGQWSVRPVGDGLYEVKIVVTKEQLAKLEQARDLDRHRNPTGDMAHTIEAAADALVAQLKKKRFAIPATPNTPPPPAPPPPTVVDNSTATTHPRRFPAAARRAIAERDGFQCGFVSADRTRCTATAFLELDHRTPHALGGISTADNGRLYCRSHNQLAARRAGLALSP